MLVAAIAWRNITINGVKDAYKRILDDVSRVYHVSLREMITYQLAYSASVNNESSLEKSGNAFK